MSPFFILDPLNATLVVFNPFYSQVISQLLRAKSVLKHQVDPMLVEWICVCKKK